MHANVIADLAGRPCPRAFDRPTLKSQHELRWLFLVQKHTGQRLLTWSLLTLTGLQHAGLDWRYRNTRPPGFFMDRMVALKQATRLPVFGTAGCDCWGRATAAPAAWPGGRRVSLVSGRRVRSCREARLPASRRGVWALRHVTRARVDSGGGFVGAGIGEFHCVGEILGHVRAILELDSDGHSD